MNDGAVPQDAHELQAIVDAEHDTLADLISTIGRLCRRSARIERDCYQCEAVLFDQCVSALNVLSTRMMSLMLAHFEREDGLMRHWPSHGATLDHCKCHQQAHAEFISRYNQLVVRQDRRSLPAYISAWEAFMVDWTRSHALEYDKEVVAQQYRLRLMA